MTALAVLAACTSSPRTPNAQLYANVDAKVDPYRHTLGVAIGLSDPTSSSNGHATQFEIEPDEHVRIGFRDQTVDLLYYPDDQNTYGYGGRFALTDEIAAGEEIRVELERNDEDDVTFTAPAPPPITLAGPATWTHTDALTLTWTPISTEPMAWSAFELDGPIPTDTGTITFPAGILPAAVDLTFSRTAQTKPAAPFRTTTFSITQASEILVEETP